MEQWSRDPELTPNIGLLRRKVSCIGQHYISLWTEELIPNLHTSTLLLAACLQGLTSIAVSQGNKLAVSG